MSSNSSASLSAVIALSADQAATVTITTPIFIAAAAIDGAKKSAECIIIRSLADDCLVLLDLLNSASADELKQLSPLVKRYVQDLSSPYAAKEYTIALDKVMGYVWTKRDPKVLARQLLVDQINGLGSSFDAFASWSVDGHTTLSNLKESSEADCKRKLSLIQSVVGLTELLNNNEPLLVLTDKIRDVRADIAAMPQWHANNIAGLQTLIVAHIDAAKQLSTDIARVRGAYKLSLLSVAPKDSKKLNMGDWVTALKALPATTIDQMQAVIGVSNRLSACVAYLLSSNRQGYAEQCGVTVDNLVQGITALESEIEKERAVQQAQNDAHKTIDSLKVEHNQQLELIKTESEEKAKYDHDMALLKDLETNCETYGLDAQYSYLLELDGASASAYRRQLQAMIAFVGEIEDQEKQNEISDLYAEMPVTINQLKEAYGDLLIEHAKASKSETASKAKMLFSKETIVNNDSKALADTLLDSLDKSIDVLLARHNDLECSKYTVLIALYQGLGVKLEQMVETRKNDRNAA